LKRDLLTYIERTTLSRDDPMFPSIKGRHLGGSWFTKKIWRPAIERAKLPVIRVHDARHTYVAHLLEGGENPVYVKEQAGHASAAFTLDRYGHLIPSRKVRRPKRKTTVNRRPN
jgi:integrase